MKKLRLKHCPKCNSTRINQTVNKLRCRKCGYEFNKEKNATITKY